MFPQFSKSQSSPPFQSFTPPSPSQRHFSTSCSASSSSSTVLKQKVKVISASTDAGKKCRLALELAKRLNGEIIGADSVHRRRTFNLDIELDFQRQVLEVVAG